MNYKAFIVLFLISFSVHAQTVVRKDGVATGADAQVSDLSMGNGLYLGIEDWRFGVQVPFVVIQELTDDPYIYESFIGVAPHLTVERFPLFPRLNGKAL